MQNLEISTESCFFVWFAAHSYLHFLSQALTAYVVTAFRVCTEVSTQAVGEQKCRTDRNITGKGDGAPKKYNKSCFRNQIVIPMRRTRCKTLLNSCERYRAQPSHNYCSSSHLRGASNEPD